MRLSLILILGSAACLSALAKDEPPRLINWPLDKPVLQFSIGSFVREGSNKEGQQAWGFPITITNVSSNLISDATFNYYLFDKQQVRIGQGIISVSNLGPSKSLKTLLYAMTMGVPASVSISPNHLPPELAASAPAKPIGVTVYSVPSGAKVSVDGKVAGVTPLVVRVVPGTHDLTFEQEGYNPGKYPLVVLPDEMTGGSVTFELGSGTHDTVELREGGVVNGDVQSLDASQVIVQVGGNLQRFTRNQVKKILLIEREEVKQ